MSHSLASMLANVPAATWEVLKLIIYGLAVIGSLVAVLFLGLCIAGCVGGMIRDLFSDGDIFASVKKMREKIKEEEGAELERLHGAEEGRRRGSADSETLYEGEGFEGK